MRKDASVRSLHTQGPRGPGWAGPAAPQLLNFNTQHVLGFKLLVGFFGFMDVFLFPLRLLLLLLLSLLILLFKTRVILVSHVKGK